MRKTLCNIILTFGGSYFVNRVVEAEAESRQFCVKHK